MVPSQYSQADHCQVPDEVESDTGCFSAVGVRERNLFQDVNKWFLPASQTQPGVCRPQPGSSHGAGTQEYRDMTGGLHIIIVL